MSNYEIKGFCNYKNWYKGNLHSHTTNSDGCLRPEESVELYKSYGYHFLCLSDHETYTDYRNDFNDETFIILPGLEASAILYESEAMRYCLKVHHIHGILGTEEMQKNAKNPLPMHKEKIPVPKYYGNWNGAQVAQELQDKLKDFGFFTIYNHPIWSRVREEEFIYTRGLQALEIYNYNTVNESGTGYDVTYFDTMLREGIRINGTASDDNHNQGLFPDSGGGYIMVNSEKLTHEDIVLNIMEGNYYSTSGPEIVDWGIKDGWVYVECSPVYKINIIVGNYLGAGITILSDSLENTITTGKFQLRGIETYVRVECVDIHGLTAWSNPIFIK